MLSRERDLLKTGYSPETADVLQAEWAARLNDPNQTVNLSASEYNIRRIAATDIAYPPDKEPSWGIACAVLWDLEDRKETEHRLVRGPIDFPYLSGFLGFREAPLCARAIEQLSIVPDLLLCDGHGRIHPRGFGEASHLGAALHIPSIGIAKSSFIGISRWREMKRTRGNREGVYKDTVVNQNPAMNASAGSLLGYALCPNDGQKPVFVSVGYGISLETAMKIVLDCTLLHRQPEPLYLADRHGRLEMKNEINGRAEKTGPGSVI